MMVPKQLLFAIYMLAIAGASVCDGKVCSLQDNSDMVQTKLTMENVSKPDKKAIAKHHARSHTQSSTKTKHASLSKSKKSSASSKDALDFDYYYYMPQQWLANMSFTLAGLDYNKILADGQLHFGVLWNLKSEISDGFGVPFENVSIFLSPGDASSLHIAAVVVAPPQILQSTPSDIDQHIISRLNSIPDINNGKTEDSATIAITVTTDRRDGGFPFIPEMPAKADPADRRRRSPATHAPTVTPVACLGAYLGTGVVSASPPAPENVAGAEVVFTCVDASHVKYPQSEKVTCGSSGAWQTLSSGTGVTNWGCGVANSCWERPKSSDGSLPTGLTGAEYVQTPFPPVLPTAYWCAGTAAQSPCCPTGQVLKDGTTALAAGILCNSGNYAAATSTLQCATP